jgi:ankyrin repeat protein
MREIKMPVAWMSANALVTRWFRFLASPRRTSTKSPARLRMFNGQVAFAVVVTTLLLVGTTWIGHQDRVLSPISADEFVRAASTHRTSLIDLYLSEHLDPNARAAQDRPLILAAALDQDWETVRRLLKAGACVDLADENGTTPLMAAAKSGKIDILREFIGLVTSVDVADRSGRSALHHAIAARKTETVEFLLPFVPDLGRHGSDLLAAALDTGDMKIANLLLERIPLLQEWSPGALRVLETSIAAGNHDQVRLLLKKHAVPPTPQGSNVPLIAYAIAREDAPLLSTLLVCGADPNTVLPQHCDKDFLALIKSKNLRNYVEEDKNVSLLMLAAASGQADYVRTLLAAGADRNRATARYKMLPLYFAAQSGYWRCTQILLGSGPRPEELRIEITLASQKLALIKDGVPVLNTICSTGRGGRYATRAGDYVITDKDRYHVSTIYKVGMPYFMRLNCLDFGMHEGVVPNYPASHGCIRLPGDVARRFFSELPVGTLVSVK